jgi:hypothetical protein
VTLETKTARKRTLIKGTQRIWVMSLSLESGMESSVHISEELAFRKLADVWFPLHREPLSKDSERRASLLLALTNGITSARDWFDEYRLDEDVSGDALIEAHELPSAILAT